MHHARKACLGGDLCARATLIGKVKLHTTIKCHEIRSRSSGSLRMLSHRLHTGKNQLRRCASFRAPETFEKGIVQFEEVLASTRVYTDNQKGDGPAEPLRQCQASVEARAGSILVGESIPASPTEGIENQSEVICGKLVCAPLRGAEELPSVGIPEEVVPSATSRRWDTLMSVVPSRVRGLVMLNLLVLLCGTNWVVVKDAGTSFDPYFFASLRFSVAAALFAPMLVSASKDPLTVKGGIEVGIYTAIGYLFQAQGLLTTDASRASFLSTFTVLVVPFLAGISGRGVRPLTWASALAALVGVSLLEQSGSPPSFGDLWSALSAMAFGVQMFRTEYWSRVLGKDSAFQLMSVVLTTTAILSTIAAAVSHPSETVALAESFFSENVGVNSDAFSSIPWAEVLYTGFLTTDVVLLMEVVALQDVSSVEASIIYTLEPVIGAAFAFIVLGERWGPMGWAGAGLIVSSCLVTQILGQDEESDGKTCMDEMN